MSVSSTPSTTAKTELVVPASNLLRAKMPELDTIRGVAVLLVLFFHGFGLRYGLQGLSGFPRLFVAATLPGWMGVNLFFVLSGFLITGILLDTKFNTNYYRSFYTRRALRILPLYYAVLLLLAVLTRTGWANRHASWAFLGLSFFYLSNITGLVGVPMQYGVLWSLAVEEHFYLLWPAAVRSLSRYRVVIAAVFICVLCPWLRAFYFIRGYDTGTGYTWLVADGLATGAVLAALARGSRGRTRVGMRSIALMSFAASAIIFSVGFPFGILRASRLFGASLRETGLNCFFAGAVALALLAGTSHWNWLVNRPVLKFFGEISYGLYLIHMLVFDLENYAVGRLFPNLTVERHFAQMVLLFCIALGFTVAVAYLSRWYFEEPFLRMKRRFDGRPSTQ